MEISFCTAVRLVTWLLPPLSLPALAPLSLLPPSELLLADESESCVAHGKKELRNCKPQATSLGARPIAAQYVFI